MKGAELPLNTIIIIVLCLIVLIAVVIIFFGATNPGKESTSLQAATQATCLRASIYCGAYNGAQPRTPVYDFDANKNGRINDIHPEPPWMTSYCIDDNLETLCGFYYGCNLPGKVFSSVCNNGVVVGTFIITEQEQKEWYDCCMKRVCGC